MTLTVCDHPRTTKGNRRGRRGGFSLSGIGFAHASFIPAVFVLASGSIAVSAELPSRPNIVLIYTDDQGQWGMGAYGNAEVRTPSMDRLAREGALFLNAFTLTPVCSPSRATLFAGRYPTELGIDDWIDPAKEPEVGLDPAIVTWPKVLQAAGYRTALVGKWHLGTAPRFHPTKNGFHRFFGLLGGGTPPMKPTFEVDGKMKTFEGAASDILASEAIRFVTEERQRPFLLCLHFRAPHSPYAPVPESDSKPYAALDPKVPAGSGLPIEPGLPIEKVKRLTREYYGSITCADRNIGRLLDALDGLGLAAKTLVLFTSDNGYMIGHHGLHHKGNGAWMVEGKTGNRPNMFEESIRVPMVARWPGVVKPGTRIERVVSNLDFFPTVLGAAGVPIPAGAAVRGRSFLPYLRGESVRGGEEDVLFGQYDMHHYMPARMRMLRTGGWKLIRHFEPGGEDELYDLGTDPGETLNLRASQGAREILERLMARLDGEMSRVGDPSKGAPGRKP